MDTTGSSIIATFIHMHDAQRAVRDLQAAGFHAQEVKLIANDRDAQLDGGVSRSYAAEPERKGGIMNFFANLFGFDEEPKIQPYSNVSLQKDSEQYFSDQYQQGRHLVVVQSSRDRLEAVRILESCGGTIEDRASRLYEQEIERTRGSAASFGEQGLREQSLGSAQVMQLKEEELVAHKDVVQTGELTLRKDVVTETRTIEVPVAREELVIERRALSGDEVASSDLHLNTSHIGEGEEIRIPVSEEQISIDKKVVPREEIRVSKQRVERTEEISEDLRREELDIEEEGRIAMRGDHIDAKMNETEARMKVKKKGNLDRDEPRPSNRPLV